MVHKLDDHIVTYLRGQIAKGRERLQEIEYEMDALVDEREDWQQKIKAMSDLVGEPDSTTTEDRVQVALFTSDLGLREAIRTVLRQEGVGLKPKYVTEKLREKGFNPPGRTDLSVRVGNELWRMAKQGALRRKSGKYYLKEPRQTTLVG